MFSDHMDRWIETYAKAHCKYSTWSNYIAVTEKHLKPAFSGKRLDEITRQDSADLINGKLAAGSGRGTVRNIISPLREMFNHAVDTGVLAANPANRCGRYMKANQAARANRMTIDPLSPRRSRSSARRVDSTLRLSDICAVSDSSSRGLANGRDLRPPMGRFGFQQPVCRSTPEHRRGTH